MSAATPSKWPRLAVRLVICGALLLWIFHAIFMNEGRMAAKREGRDWENLPRSARWSQAWRLGPRELWHSVRRVNPGIFALATIVMGGTLLLGVVRWRMVLRTQGLDLPFNRALEISLVAHFFNSFLLGSTGGDLMKAYYAARETHHKKTEAVTTVFVDRLVGLWAMLLFAGVMMIPNWRLLIEHEKLAAVSWLVLAMLVGCSVTLVLAFYGGLSRRWPGARAFLRRLPVGEHLERSLDACRQFGRERFFLTRTLAVSMLLNAVCVAQFILLAHGLHLRVEEKALFVIVPIIICISALPITPSGLGVRENLFVVMLTVPEIADDPTQALALSLLAYGGSLAWSIVGGFVYATLKDQHHLDDVAREEPGEG